MSDDSIKAAAERYAKHKAEPQKSPYQRWLSEHTGGYFQFDHEGFKADLRTLADAYLALGERQEDRWTHQRDSDGALSMFMYSTPQAAANSFHAEKGGCIVRVSTFIREEGEGA